MLKLKYKKFLDNFNLFIFYPFSNYTGQQYAPKSGTFIFERYQCLDRYTLLREIWDAQIVDNCNGSAMFTVNISEDLPMRRRLESDVSSTINWPSVGYRDDLNEYFTFNCSGYETYNVNAPDCNVLRVNTTNILDDNCDEDGMVDNNVSLSMWAITDICWRRNMMNESLILKCTGLLIRW